MSESQYSAHQLPAKRLDPDELQLGRNTRRRNTYASMTVEAKEIFLEAKRSKYAATKGGSTVDGSEMAELDLDSSGHGADVSSLTGPRKMEDPLETPILDRKSMYLAGGNGLVRTSAS